MSWWSKFVSSKLATVLTLGGNKLLDIPVTAFSQSRRDEQKREQYEKNINDMGYTLEEWFKIHPEAEDEYNNLKGVGSFGSELSKAINGENDSTLSALVNGVSKDKRLNRFGKSIDSYIDTVTGERDTAENEKNRQFQSEQAEVARQWEAEQAKTAREWDSIGAQMERAASVGVNPVSIAMQNGGINGSLGTSIPASPGIPAGSSGLMHNGALDIASMIFNGIGTLAENRLKQSQSDDIVAMRQYNIAEKMANTDHLRSLAEGVGLSNVAQQIQNDWLDRLNQATYDNMLRDLGYKDSEILKNRSVVKLNLQQRAQIRQDMQLNLERFNATLPLELKLTEAEINLKNSSVKEVYEEISLRHLQAIEQESRNMQASAEADIAQTQANIAKQTYEDAINDFHNDMVRGAAEAGIRLNDYMFYGASPIPAGSMPSMLINTLSSGSSRVGTGSYTDPNIKGVNYDHFKYKP